VGFVEAKLTSSRSHAGIIAVDEAVGSVAVNHSTTLVSVEAETRKPIWFCVSLTRANNPERAQVSTQTEKEMLAWVTHGIWTSSFSVAKN